jgi:hypothetical protein
VKRPSVLTLRLPPGARLGSTRPPPVPRPPPIAWEDRPQRKARTRKYGNEPTKVGDIEFDSKAEARYWVHLQWRIKSSLLR